ncbi:MAG: hypothetical protein ABW328_11580 [Ilumatobacteraceae bacterium]
MGLFRRAPSLPPDVPQRVDIEHLQSELAQLREAMVGHDTSCSMLAARVTEIDARVTSVATELANQLTELGHDIDALGDHPTGVGEQALAEVRAGQVRLATEQARYQMAFREDLATLAAQLTRAR